MMLQLDKKNCFHDKEFCLKQIYKSYLPCEQSKCDSEYITSDATYSGLKTLLDLLNLCLIIGSVKLQLPKQIS